MMMADDGVPDAQCVLPEQFLGVKQSSARHSSTHRLMLGVLADAVALYQRARDPRRPMLPSHRREIVAWFNSRDRRWLFSFERVCEALEIDADYLRRGIEQPSSSPRIPIPLSVGGRADRRGPEASRVALRARS